MAFLKSLRKTFQAWSRCRCRPPLKFVLAAELQQSDPAKRCQYAHSTILRMAVCNTHTVGVHYHYSESAKLNIWFIAQYFFSGYKPLQQDPSSSCLSVHRTQSPRIWKNITLDLLWFIKNPSILQPRASLFYCWLCFGIRKQCRIQIWDFTQYWWRW